MAEKVAIQGGTAAVDLGAILANPASINAEQTYHIVRNLVNAHPDAEKIRESLVTALSFETEKGKSEFGATMTDHFAGTDSPSTLYTSPYSRSGAGSTIAVTYGDTETQDVYVLLARKRDPQNPSQLKNEYIMVGGYFEPHEPGQLDSKHPYDQNLAQTAIRELREETGLQLPEGYVPHPLTVNSDYGVSNDPRLHTVNAFYHVGLTGPLSSRPNLQPNDDVAELVWVNAKDITFHPEIGPQLFNSDQSRYVVHMPNGDMNLRDGFGEALDMAVARTRNIMTESYKNRLSILKEEMQKPSSALGPEADNYHRQTLQRLNDKALGQQNWADLATSQNAKATINR
ncbi:MAG: NUDIX hydrolase [Rickettsiales bacterium]